MHHYKKANSISFLPQWCVLGMHCQVIHFSFAVNWFLQTAETVFYIMLNYVPVTDFASHALLYCSIQYTTQYIFKNSFPPQMFSSPIVTFSLTLQYKLELTMKNVLHFALTTVYWHNKLQSSRTRSQCLVAGWLQSLPFMWDGLTSTPSLGGLTQPFNRVR